MERIKLIRSSPVLSWTVIVIGSLNAVFGLIGLIDPVREAFNIKGSHGAANAVIFTIQGLIFVVWGSVNLYNKRYYIEWDENELRMLLPDTRKPELLSISDIQSVNIKLFEIEVKLPDSVRLIDLNGVCYDDLRKVKSKFESIQNLPHLKVM